MWHLSKSPTVWTLLGALTFASYWNILHARVSQVTQFGRRVGKKRNCVYAHTHTLCICVKVKFYPCISYFTVWLIQQQGNCPRCFLNGRLSWPQNHSGNFEEESMSWLWRELNSDSINPQPCCYTDYVNTSPYINACVCLCRCVCVCVCGWVCVCICWVRIVEDLYH